MVASSDLRHFTNFSLSLSLSLSLSRGSRASGKTVERKGCGYQGRVLQDKYICEDIDIYYT